jgi:haloalkane dehalogenase|tara:strand:+ start:581 stop:1444 length:864 start_codon:yes stop_codon:yes gene_type:complete
MNKQYIKKKIDVKSKQMAYIDVGQGEDTFLLIHGNPSSSFIWRNIAPELEKVGRVVMPDLIGMGDSDKLDGINNEEYSFNGHYSYLEDLFNKLDLNNVHLVIQDWGSALGFKLARLNSSKIKSITFMEAIVRPLTWDEWPEAGTKIFKLMRSEAGEEIVLEKNFFVERLLLGEARLSEEEQAEYRRPFMNAGEDRRPTLTWPRNIPLDNEPADTTHEVQLNANFHKDSDIPKLFINADPGFLLVGDQREFVRSWKNLKEVTVKGNHFIQETSPEEISKEITAFVKSL